MQTVWMLLAAIFAALTFKFSFYSGNMPVGAAGTGHVYRSITAIPTIFVSGSSGSVLILIITVLLIAGSLVNIFNYKARKKQGWITLGLAVLSLLNILLYWKASGVPPFLEGKYDLTAVLTLAIPIFLFFALRGILRDQKLVKSADRLR